MKSSTSVYLSLLASVAVIAYFALESVEAGPTGVFGTSDQVCGPNEEYTSCGTSCPDTCDTILNPSANRICTMNCVPGCFCIRDHVRDSNKKCIPEYECTHPRGLNGAAPGGAMAVRQSMGLVLVTSFLVVVFSTFKFNHNLLF